MCKYVRQNLITSKKFIDAKSYNYDLIHKEANKYFEKVHQIRNKYLVGC